MFLSYFRLSWQSIKNRSLRSWLTILGIIIGVTAVVALISIGQGMNDSIEEQFKTLGYNTITVSAGDFEGVMGGMRTMGGGGNSDSYLDPAVLERLNMMIKNSGTTRTETGMVNSEELEGQAFLDVMGIEESVVNNFDGYFGGFEFESGEIFSFSGETKEAVLGMDVAKDLGVGVGEEFQLEGESFLVTGILASEEEETSGGPKFGSNTGNLILVPFSTMDKIYGGGSKASRVLVEVYEEPPANAQGGGKADFSVSKIASRIEELYSGEDTPVTTITAEEISNKISDTLGILNVALIGIAAISLLVGAVGVMNTMYTAVLERTREIGIMKAVGARNSDVMYLFLTESGLLGLFGGIVGTLFGIGISFASGNFLSRALPTGIPFGPTLSPGLLIGAVAFSFLLGSLSGVFPARQAANLQPVEALRYE